MPFGTFFGSGKTETADDPAAIDNDQIIQALMRSQAFISFKPDGTILNANENFLSTLGYELEEVQGKHHSMFCETEYASTEEYQAFWAHLAAGNFHSDEFKRIDKHGQAVHIQATYNPILNAEGEVTQVVKFATNITTRVANVEALASGLQTIAAGDLKARIDEPFGQDLERLRIDFNAATLLCRKSCGRSPKRARGSISQGTDEISQASDDLSRRTEAQAGRLSETSSTFAEIADAVKQTAASASSAREIVSTAHADAEENGAIMEQAVEAMRSIESSSKEIAEIISVIDEIAYQTNLLALNAGVEAARAGDAGRGFAVVASEVRALAQRSADAAKQIKNLITVSGERVGVGVSRVQKAGDALQKIIVGITEVTEKSTEIAEAAEDQSQSLQKVSDLVAQMDQITQQNAAMVEETTAATRSLADKSKELARVVNQFETHDATQGGTGHQHFGVAA